MRTGRGLVCADAGEVGGVEAEAAGRQVGQQRVEEPCGWGREMRWGGTTWEIWKPRGVKKSQIGAGFILRSNIPPPPAASAGWVGFTSLEVRWGGGVGGLTLS